MQPSHMILPLINAIFCVPVLLFAATATAQIYMPLAPFQPKIRCHAGLKSKAESGNVTECPLASTSCGYFQLTSGPKNNSFYECIDSSIFASANDEEAEEDNERQFRQYCDDRPRCHILRPDSLNDRFVDYMSGHYGITAKFLNTSSIKFCCAVSSSRLKMLVYSEKRELPKLSTNEVNCGGKKCRSGAVGCLIYEQTIHLKPEVLQFYDDFEQMDLSKEYDDGVHVKKRVVKHWCVHQHFSDEKFRYCLLVYSRPNTTQRCYDGSDYRVCCCFVGSGEKTCDPMAVYTTAAPTPKPQSDTTARPEKDSIGHRPFSLSPQVYNSARRRTSTTLQASCKMEEEQDEDDEPGEKKKKKKICSVNVEKAAKSGSSLTLCLVIQLFCHFTYFLSPPLFSL